VAKRKTPGKVMQFAEGIGSPAPENEAPQERRVLILITHGARVNSKEPFVQNKSTVSGEEEKTIGDKGLFLQGLASRTESRISGKPQQVPNPPEEVHSEHLEGA
jgi:hypothetical protein